MKNTILLCALFFTILLIAQNPKRQLEHYGNDFEVKLDPSNEESTVYITNKSNDNDSKLINVLNTITEAEFQQKLEKEFNALIEDYLFSSDIIKTLTLTANQVSNIKNLNSDYFEKFTPENNAVKNAFVAKFGYTADNFNFQDFKTKIDNETLQEVKDLSIIKKDTDQYSLNNTEISLTKEDEFINQLNNIASQDNGIIYKVLFQEEIEKLVKTEFNATNNRIIAELYEDGFTNDGFKFIGNYQSVVFKDSKSQDDKTNYAVEIQQYPKEKYFILRFCSKSDNAYTCKHTIKMDFDISKQRFKEIINETITKEKTLTDEDRGSLYQKCFTTNESSYEKIIKEPFSKEADSLIKLLEKERVKYSGVLKLKSEVVLYAYPVTKKYKEKNEDDGNGRKFKPSYASVRFFNNKVNSVVVVGNVINDKEEVIFEEVSVNYQWSFPIRSFNSNLQSISILNEFGKELGWLNYNELFQYYPYDENFNYAVKNKEYKILAGDTVNVEQRSLLNYFTPIIFSDFLGLNPGSENGLLFAEGRTIIPLWLFNKKYTSYITKLRADLNVSLYNGFDDSSRAITESGSAELTEANPLNVSLFDYVKFANVMAGMSMDLFNLELKGLSTDASFGFGVRYYRAALNYTQTNTMGADIVLSDQLNAIAPEFNLNFEIRPQMNFGADLNFSYSWLNARGSLNDIPIDIIGNEKDKRMFRLNLDIFSKVNPDDSNGGLYARLGGFYHLETKDLYPQIMVGYATNLSSFVNKFKKNE